MSKWTKAEAIKCLEERRDPFEQTPMQKAKAKLSDIIASMRGNGQKEVPPIQR